MSPVCHASRRTAAWLRCACRYRRTPFWSPAPCIAAAKSRSLCGCRRRTAGSRTCRRRTTNNPCPPRPRLESALCRLSPAARSCRPSRLCMHPGFAAGFCKLAHARDVALPLGHRDHAAGVEQIEDVAGLDALVIGRQCHQVRLALAVLPSGIEISLAGFFRHGELLEQHVGVGEFEIVPRIFLLGLQEYVAVADALRAFAAIKIEIVDAVD